MRVNETTVEGFDFDGNLAIADKDVSKIIDIVARDYKHDSTPIREAIINGIEAIEGDKAVSYTHLTLPTSDRG